MDHQQHSHPSNRTVAHVAGLGASIGLVHVLTGPDHLSAIAALASGSGGKSRSFLLGIRWGCGHSLGTVLIFAVFVLLPEINMESVGSAGGIIAGVVMMLIGFFGVFQARKKYFLAMDQGSITTVSDEKINKPDDMKLLGSFVAAKTEEVEVEEVQQSGPLKYFVRAPARLDSDRLVNSCKKNNLPSSSCPAPPMDDDIEKDTLSLHRDVVDDATAHDRGILHASVSRICTPPCAMCPQSMDLLLVVLIGLIQGVAGAGGVLAVIPAMSIKHDSDQAAAYLVAFFAASILAMGALAAMAGELSGRMGCTALLEYRIAVAASLLSVAIGIAWEILLSLDMIDTVFP